MNTDPLQHPKFRTRRKRIDVHRLQHMPNLPETQNLHLVQGGISCSCRITSAGYQRSDKRVNAELQRILLQRDVYMANGAGGRVT